MRAREAGVNAEFGISEECVGEAGNGSWESDSGKVKEGAYICFETEKTARHRPSASERTRQKNLLRRVIANK